MNYFELYPGDYLKATGRLTLVDHGAYLRLMLEYYATEQPLPEDLGELYVIAAAVSAADKAAVRKVADRFFPVGDDGLRHNGRADDEIAKAQKRIATARSNGAKGGRKQPSNNPAGNPEGTQRVAGWDAQQGTHSGEALHTPHAISTPEGSKRAEDPQSARSPESPTPLDPTAAGRACLAMRRGGLMQTNPSHPQLLAAIAEGATDDALWEDTAREGAGHDPPKGFAWVIATVRGRLADAANAPRGTTHAAHRQPSPRRESLTARAARINAEHDRRGH